MPQPGPTDTELMGRLAAGDEQALSELYDRYAPRVYGLVLRLVGDADAAEEVTQDVFVRLWQHAGSFDDGRGSLATWLLTIARRRAIDHLRARSRRAQEGPLPADLGDQEDVGARAEVGLLAADVDRALRHLPDPLRQVIEHAYFLGQSHREIARSLGIPLGTVKTRLRTAVERLRDALAPGEASRG